MTPTAPGLTSWDPNFKMIPQHGIGSRYSQRFFASQNPPIQKSYQANMKDTLGTIHVSLNLLAVLQLGRPLGTPRT